ncbi:dethiobiotin synthase [Mucilaginibacter sp. ZT4R22]|uniref:ATP-dependent dethiobiotin synthetase BioD n=1 Tax=Mucilaginibacter pankratovii TaxID=2772110 RepID=A0ABR7WIN9_9SPHI|nr:dethiobiotin synthase [Mucilaginibacter pankratovii]MBD1362188.1 dethiobiotin synthase [Mucilaginibacter pankratovii]
MLNKPLFITGIGTGIGKTLVAAIVVEKLKADYWKPIQSGDLDNSDTMKVQSLVSNTKTVFHWESYRLKQPYSPHKSAKLDGIVIDEHSIITPKTNNQLIIEGAGGLMVPLNDHFLMIDLIRQLDAEVILVSQNYLGSINHTLLSAEVLKQRGIPIKGIIFNGDTEASSEEYILNYTQIPLLGRVPVLAEITPLSVAEAGGYLSF